MKISVIIPIYNMKDCLERCVRSVQAQDYPDMEIILVDDGSTDGSGELADSLAASDPAERTRVLHSINGGSSAARNLGIRSASGDYLGFVDSDDFIEPDMYSLLAGAAGEHDLLIAQTGRDEISPDGSSRADVVAIPEQYTEVSAVDFLRELLLHKGDCSFCTKLVSRRLFDISLFPEGELNEDFRLLVEFLTAGEGADKIGIIPHVGYHVFYRDVSNTRNTDRNVFPRVFTDIVVNADRMEHLVGERYPELEQYARRFALVQRLDYMLHIPVKMMTADNSFYIEVREYLKKNKHEIRVNPYLNDDQRSKLKLLSTAPKTVRWIHLQKMKLQGGKR